MSEILRRTIILLGSARYLFSVDVPLIADELTGAVIHEEHIIPFGTQPVIGTFRIRRRSTAIDTVDMIDLLAREHKIGYSGFLEHDIIEAEVVAVMRRIEVFDADLYIRSVTGCFPTNGLLVPAVEFLLLT